MVVGEAVELFIVFLLILLGIWLIHLIQKMTGTGVD